MTTLIALIAGYIGLLAALFLIARPYRIELNELANCVVAEQPGNDALRALCETYLRTAYSWRAAPIRFVMFLLALLIPARLLERDCRKAEQDNPGLFGDPRLHRIIDCYSVSVFAVNPIFGILMYFARWMFRIKVRVYHHGKAGQKLTDFVGMKSYA